MVTLSYSEHLILGDDIFDEGVPLLSEEGPDIDQIFERPVCQFLNVIELSLSRLVSRLYASIDQGFIYDIEDPVREEGTMCGTKGAITLSVGSHLPLVLNAGIIY